MLWKLSYPLAKYTKLCILPYYVYLKSFFPLKPGSQDWYKFDQKDKFIFLVVSEIQITSEIETNSAFNTSINFIHRFN